jgi:hypothetical protein
VPNIVDYAVELDNTIYRQRGTGSILLSPDFSFTSTRKSQRDDGHAFSPHASLFTSPESTSFGSSLYTGYTKEHPLELTETPIFSPVPLVPPLVEGGVEDVHDGGDGARDWNSPPPSNGPLARTTTVSQSQVATAPSPTPSLCHSDASVFSSPSPVSPADTDVVKVVKVGEERGYNWLMPSPFTRSSKRMAGGRSAPTAKNGSSSTKSTIPLSRPGAARFPCTVPGCKQVCKTLGDLKRHESVLSHKPPSWKCSRCDYRFTREDALKRHTRNLPKCASTKNNLRGRAASTKTRRVEDDSDVEAI